MFKLNLFAFILAFAIGIGCCYVINPPPKVVMKFPSPNNVGKVIYRDSEENCFTFRADKVQCTKDARPQPIQIEEDFSNQKRRRHMETSLSRRHV